MAFLGSPAAPKHLTLDYRASQPTGWEALSYTPTLEVGTSRRSSSPTEGRATAVSPRSTALKIVNFSDFIHIATDATILPSNRLVAETFLVQDTGKKNASGKDVVDIFGGVKWGWQLQPVT